MASSEKFCLRWNDFESNISSAFKELREDKEFFDVTLACDDDREVQAHKVILSACSSFFRTILKRVSQHNHPLLYLKGVTHNDLTAVLNFMYHGEVKVAQDELNSFLAVAEDLKVKGLTQGQDSDKPTGKLSARGGSSSSNASGVKDKLSLSSPHRPCNTSENSEDGQTASKRPRTVMLPSSGQSQAASNSKIHSSLKAGSSREATLSHYDDDDDIQEVVPVKTELGSSETAIISRQDDPNPGHMVSHAMDSYSGTDEVEEGVDYGGEGEDYTDYGDPGYDTSYDSSLMDPGMTGVDGNKGLGENCALYMRSVEKDGKLGWECGICTKVYVARTAMEDHLRLQHFGVDQTFPCNLCGKQFQSRNSRSGHISKVHKNLDCLKY